MKVFDTFYKSLKHSKISETNFSIPALVGGLIAKTAPDVVASHERKRMPS